MYNSLLHITPRLTFFDLKSKKYYKISPLIPKQPLTHTNTMYNKYWREIKSVLILTSYLQYNKLQSLCRVKHIAMLYKLYKLNAWYIVTKHPIKAGRRSNKFKIYVRFSWMSQKTQPLMLIKQQNKLVMLHSIMQKNWFIFIIWARQKNKKDHMPNFYDYTLYDPDYPAHIPTYRFKLIIC